MHTVPEPEKNIVVVSGPAGSGKDTIIDSAVQSGKFEKVVTTTSRPVRDHETNGNPYYFLSQAEFEEKIKAGDFIEYSQNENGAYYGVEKVHFEKALEKGKKMIWKVDWKGALHIRELLPQIKNICIMASLETLNKRVRLREGSSYTEKYFQERTEYAKDYFTHLDDYDYVIWNEDNQLEKSIEEFTSILKQITGS